MELKPSAHETTVEDIIDELGDQVVDDLRRAAETQMMPHMAAALRGMPTPMAEAVVAQVLWYLDQRSHASPQRVQKLLRLCQAGARLGASEGWLLGPAAKA